MLEADSRTVEKELEQHSRQTRVQYGEQLKEMGIDVDAPGLITLESADGKQRMFHRYACGSVREISG